jgi:hypothetical protein
MLMAEFRAVPSDAGSTPAIKNESKDEEDLQRRIETVGAGGGKDPGITGAPVKATTTYKNTLEGISVSRTGNLLSLRVSRISYVPLRGNLA